MKLEIKEPNRMNFFLIGMAWLCLGLSTFLFYKQDFSVEDQKLFVAGFFLFSLLLFSVAYLVFPKKKSGEIILDKSKIVIKKTKRKNVINYDKIEKIKLKLARHEDRFHRDWWPIDDAPPVYEPSSHNLLNIRTKKGESFQTSFHIDQKISERNLVRTLHKIEKKHRVKLRIG